VTPPSIAATTLPPANLHLVQINRWPALTKVFYILFARPPYIGWTIKLVSFFFKESNFQIVGVFCATKFFFLIFDTLKKTDQLNGPPYIN
jgi:hypothetical protein